MTDPDQKNLETVPDPHIQKLAEKAVQIVYEKGHIFRRR